MKQQDNVRTQVIRESSSPSANKQSAPVVKFYPSDRATPEADKDHTEKNVTKSTVNKTAHRKGSKK